MKIKLLLTFSLVFVFQNFNLLAQTNQLEKADKLFEDFAYLEAIEIYEAIALNGEFDNHIGKQLAEAYRRIGNTEETEYWYSQLIAQGSTDPIDYYYYAQALKANGKDTESQKWLLKFAQANNTDSRPVHEVETREKNTIDSLDIEIHKLSINSSNSDFGAAFYNDQVVFSSARSVEALLPRIYVWDGQPFLDLYVSDLNGTVQLKTPQLFSQEINTRFHEGPVAFANNYKTMFFTRNNFLGKKVGKSSEGTNNLKIYISLNIGGIWGGITEFTFNSDEYSCGHPTVTEGGDTMYFVSDMPGGLGGTDIYVTYRNGSEWTTPLNLGKNINTEGNEMFPFYHESGFLYFSSDGRGGEGGLDVFRTFKMETDFTVPQNLGKVVNTRKDDFNFVINKEGNAGYLSSNRRGGEGKDDIYAFIVKTPNIVASNDPRDNNTMRPPTNNNNNNNDNNNNNQTNQNNQPDEPLMFDGREVYRGERFVIQNIYYDLDKYNIRPDAQIELNKVIQFMQHYPNAIIELSSHTDCRASWEYNMTLSQNRAQSAVDWIVKYGNIDKRRIIARGYGETLLTNECADDVECNEDQHQANRRTEITILRQ